MPPPPPRLGFFSCQDNDLDAFNNQEVGLFTGLGGDMTRMGGCVVRGGVRIIYLSTICL